VSHDTKLIIQHTGWSKK